MGIPLPLTANPLTAASPSGDRAQQVVSGSFSAVGQVSQPFNIYGAFNVSLFGAASVSLITGANSLKATINDAASSQGLGIAPGASVNSAAVPPGTVIASITLGSINVGGMSTVQLGGLTTSQIATIAVATTAALISGSGVQPVCTVQLQRSFDGGATFFPAGIGGGGQPAEYTFGGSGILNAVSFVAAEPELGVAYRLVCTSFTSGVPLYYRISISGLAAMAWGIPIG